MKLVILVVALAFTACARQSPAPVASSSPAPEQVKRVTSTSVVHATAGPVEVGAAGTGELAVRIQIDNGYHVNANPPTYPYLKPTELVITSGQGFTDANVRYPAAQTKKFAFAEKPLSVYEGEVEVKATIKTDANVGKGDHVMPARLNVQACDDQVCYPPGQIELAVPVKRM